MSPKEPRDPKKDRKTPQDFEEPAARGTQPSETPELSDEEARAEEFETPTEEPGYVEDVASLQAQSAPAGVPRNLIEIKAQIEQELRRNAVNGVVQAESAFQGSSNIVGVGIGLGET